MDWVRACMCCQTCCLKTVCCSCTATHAGGGGSARPGDSLLVFKQQQILRKACMREDRCAGSLTLLPLAPCARRTRR